MYPLERSLVQRFSDRPFAIVGINSDGERELALRRSQEEKLSWRSFWDGQHGPIAKRWGVRQWPTVYLIDAEGVIRAVDPPDAKLEPLIESLLSKSDSARRR